MRGDLVAEPRAQRGLEAVVGTGRGGPLPPCPAPKAVLERPVAGIGIQPRGLRHLKFLEALGPERGRPCEAVAVVCLAQERVLQPVERPEVDVARAERRQRGQFLRKQELAPHKVLKVDQVGVARERGEGLVGGIPVTRWPEWADLPPGDPRILEEIKEADRGAVQRPDALVAREARRVQEHAGGPRREPVEQGFALGPPWCHRAYLGAHAAGAKPKRGGLGRNSSGARRGQPWGLNILLLGVACRTNPRLPNRVEPEPRKTPLTKHHP